VTRKVWTRKSLILRSPFALSFETALRVGTLALTDPQDEGKRASRRMRGYSNRFSMLYVSVATTVVRQASCVPIQKFAQSAAPMSLAV
jgi:hypothetical protein